jgi:PAS domain S-box-containing protein
MTGQQQPINITQKLHERLDLDFALQAAGLGVWEMDPVTNLITWDDRCRQLFGMDSPKIIAYEEALPYIHPDDRDRVQTAVRQAVAPQGTGAYDMTYRTIGANDGQIRWVRFMGRAYFDPTGQLYRFGGIAQDLTPQVLAHQKLSESETRFRTMAEGSSILIAVSDENGQSTYLNQAWTELTGRSVDDLMNLGWVDLVHPADRDPFLNLYQSALSQQKSFSGEFRILNKNGVYSWLLVNCPARFQHGMDGSDPIFTGYISSALDITDRKQVEEALQASEARLQSVIATAPAGMAVFMGRDLLIELPNQTFVDMLGKGPDIVGKPLRDIMSELQSENQPYLQILDQVYTSGQMYQSYGSPVSIVRDGVATRGYYNISFTPLRNETDQLYAILVMALDVTEQVEAQQALAESEAHLELLRDTVPAMIFYIDKEQRYRSYNGVFKQWFGVADKEVIGKTVREFLGEATYQKAWPHLAKALAGEQERYELFAPSRMKTNRWLDIVYTPHKSATGELLGVIVHATDITPSKQAEISLRNSEARYRALSADLEQQVQQRTRELAAANEELAALNVELSERNRELVSSNLATNAANESLSESNHNLSRSNDNLEKFAYIASHDLQEPLRKIQQFGDLLKTQYADTLGDGTDYLERMQTAASRMSRLIKDLLTFSRISTRQDAITSVSLREVIDSALSDLEVRLDETGAVVHVDTLPTVAGDRSQLEQLFQNLLSNALKFQLKDVKPTIHIRYQLTPAGELPALVRPARKARQYHCVQVSDNGIGFDDKYADRIFQVFQRLHGKNEYAGTGIGLAICEKVVANHGGAILATSQLGRGATFTVYLPAYTTEAA